MMTSSDPLTQPVWASLTSGHATLAEVCGLAAGYPTEVADLHAVADPLDRRAWADLAVLAGPATAITVPGGPDLPGRGWTVHRRRSAIQLTGPRIRVCADPRVVTLTNDDLADMHALAQRAGTKRLWTRCLALGHHLGVRRRGRLIAMAGERLRPTGWAEISAVHVDPAFAGRGWEAGIVAALAHAIEQRGERPFLHVLASDAVRVRRFGALGFTDRRPITFHSYRRVTSRRL
ncbi:GNAT family N-acetyltransferase [Paractinoplanes brasiliensis]|uniref:FR47-like protein n=1 Tax=Paractinoplanes brasiliensis TaxID=52695 RepID=A0A4R6JMF5_9ACTN|nr:GNAT family N-acetyltransferase [Actinoplanes brasiliensis]TDO37047.1 FR47-like protein [Actinoplanes brasiliensis]GID32259.1 GNAT family N-acetyltransferase [Actinoplanes brasiliensis]